MKKVVFLVFLVISQMLQSLPLCDRTVDRDALAQLMQKLDVPCDDLNAEMQKRFLRSSGQERWQMQELCPEHRAYVLAWAQEQGLYTPWHPSETQYDHALILGATTRIMQLRLQYLKQLWDEGIRFNEVFFLTGDRPLDARADSLFDVCQNESEAAFYIWEKADLSDEMRSLPVHFIAVPMKKENDQLKRPNTEDTVRAYLAHLDGPHQALFISDQPFCGYQFAIIKTVLPKEFTFDVAGAVPCVNPSQHPQAAAITLDTVARWLYQEDIYYNRLHP